MNAAGNADPGREVARALTDALDAVCGERAELDTLHAARQVAGLLTLPGLDHLLAMLEPHAGRPWPGELEGALDRLRRLSARCAEEGDPEVLRASDPDLGGLAAEIEALEWSRSGAQGAADSAAFRTVRASDALADLPLESQGDERLHKAKLTAPVAAALRAALDWVSGESGPRRALAVAVEEGVLEVVCTVQDPAALAAAHAVLSPIGGQIGPWLAEMPTSGRWVMRVPLVTPRALHLMVEQGALKLALPWTSVIRVLMLPAGEIEERARLLAPDVPLLPPLAPLTHGDDERPVVLIASGLLRGLMTADRLVWRLGAESCPAPGPAPAPLHEAVLGDDGEIYWVADPAVLLAPLPLPAAASRPGGPSSEVTLEAVDVHPLPLFAPASDAVQQQERVEARPRALVVEDSITARIFLTRMLESRGFEVRPVADALDALRELGSRPWHLICADVELADVRGTGWLRMLQERAGPGPVIAALVRDRADRDVAHSVGISRTLRKPFDESEVDALVQELHAGMRGAV